MNATIEYEEALPTGTSEAGSKSGSFVAHGGAASSSTVTVTELSHYQEDGEDEDEEEEDVDIEEESSFYYGDELLPLQNTNMANEELNAATYIENATATL